MSPIVTKLDLRHDPLPQLVRLTSVPAITGMLFGTLYNIVDTIYAGLLSPEALAALTMSFPVFFLTVLAFAVGFSNGLKAVVAFALGQDDKVRAGRIIMQGIPLAVFSGTLINIAAFLLLDFILDSMQGDSASKALAKQYLSIILLGGVTMNVLYALVGPLGAIGDTVTVRNSEIAGAVANVILNPILMFGWLGLPALGLYGLALATVLVWMASGVYAFYRLRQSELWSLLGWHCMRPQTGLCQEILRQAIPGTLNMIRIGIIFAIFSLVMGKFGTYVLAGYGVGFRIEGLIVLPVIGLNMASMAIFAQNYGANNYDRVRALYRFVLVLGFSFMAIGGVFLYFAAPWLVIPFSDDSQTIYHAVEYLRIDAFGLPAIAIINLSVAMLQGMQRTILSLILLIITQAVLPGFLLPYVAEVSGYHEAWWAMVAILWVSAIAMLILINVIMRQWKQHLLLHHHATAQP